MVRSIQQLEALRDEWDALAQSFRNPMMSHDWFASCAEAFYGGEDLRVVITRRHGDLSGVAPLAREATPQGERLFLLGASRLYEPSGWLFDSPADLEELLEHTMRLGHAIVLQRVPVESPLVGVVAALPPTRGVGIVRGATTSLGVVTTGSWEAYYSSLSSHITGNLRRLRRKAEKAIGPISVVRAEPAQSEVDGHLETLVRVEGSGWKARRGSALASRPDLRDFFRRYAHRAAARRQLRVTTVSFGSEIAAIELAVEAYDRIWQLKIGYADALRPYYPGLHLTEASLRAAFDRGLEAYEFLGSAASWEERWAPEERRYRMLAIYPFTTRGMLTGCRDLAGIVWRRAAQAINRPAALEGTP